jgi:hypothetical protein
MDYDVLMPRVHLYKVHRKRHPFVLIDPMLLLLIQPVVLAGSHLFLCHLIFVVKFVVKFDVLFVFAVEGRCPASIRVSLLAQRHLPLVFLKYDDVVKN